MGRVLVPVFSPAAIGRLTAEGPGGPDAGEGAVCDGDRDAGDGDGRVRPCWRMWHIDVCAILHRLSVFTRYSPGAGKMSVEHSQTTIINSW